MLSKFLPLAVIVLLSIIGAIADSFIKLASREHQSLKSPWFWLGATIYFSTAFAWVYVLRHIKLSLIGVIYSYCTVTALILVGVLFFGETLSRTEILGIVLGFISIGLLARFI
jgi:drug/metabolite transporter (DMT)-like permease